VTMEQCIKVRKAKLRPTGLEEIGFVRFLSAFICVHPWLIQFSRRCSIMGMGLFRKKGCHHGSN
jgi:hypothetical protein